MAIKSPAVVINAASKLTDKNYSTWKFSMQTTLQARDLWKFCLHKDTKELVSNAEAKSIIWSSMSDEQKARVGNCETAHDLWTKIQDTFEGSKTSLQTRTLKEFLTIKYNADETIAQFCTRYETLLNKLITTGYTMEEKTKIWVFKNTLPEPLYIQCDTWEMLKEYPTANELVTLMRSRDRGEGPSDSSVALYVDEQGAARSNASKSPSRFASNPKLQTMTCNYCKKPGHMWRGCRKKKADDKRKKTYASKKKPEQAFLAVCENITGSNTEKLAGSRWVVDSGASRHMTPMKEWLQNYRPFAFPHAILVGNGKDIKSFGLGDVVFKQGKKTARLAGVLYSPELTANLFSVKQSTKQGFDIRFNNKRVVVQKQGQIKLSGTQLGRGLYTLDLKIIQPKRNTVEQALVGVSLDDWHERFSHASHRSIKELARANAVDGLQIDHVQQNECEHCAVCKVTKTTHPSRQSIGNSNAVVLHLDTCGPMKVASLGGNKYFVLATDQRSGFMLIKFVRSKDCIPDSVKEIITEADFYAGRKVAMVVSDNGSEFKNKDLSSWLKKKGIIQEFAAPGVPQQNGRAERSNRTVIERARTLLASSRLPEFLWCEAANTTVYTSNRQLSSRDRVKTKYELFIGQRPNVKHLRIFGQRVVAQTRKHERRSKWSPVGEIYRFVGYTTRSNTYRLYDEEKKTIFVACDVKFLDRCEVPTDIEQNDQEEGSNYDLITYKPARKTVSWNLPEELSASDTEVYDASETVEGRPSESTSGAHQTEIDTEGDNLFRDSVNDAIHQEVRDATKSRPSAPDSLEIPEQMGRSMKPLFVNMNRLTPEEIAQWRSSTPRRPDRLEGSRGGDPESSVLNKPGTAASDPAGDSPTYEQVDDDEMETSGPISGYYDAWNTDTAMFCLEDEPITVTDALKSADSDKWKAGMDKKMDSLAKNGTWKLINKPDGVKPVKCKWVFKKKMNQDGSVGEYKARLVAKGFSQIPGIDYKETFAPVAQMNTIRSLFAIANQLDLEIVQFDVKTAFLYGDLDETIYMEYPEGYPNPKNQVCKLVKSLYGLKQSPRQWNKKFDHFLKAFNLKQSINDRCLYYNKSKSVFLTIYVDDGLVVGKDKQLINKLMAHLKSNLEIKQMDCRSYLGFQVERNRKERTLVLHQRRYIENILERFHMTDCNQVSTPEEVGAFDSRNSPKLTENFPFKEAIGSLLYLVTCTRPDIAHAVSIASRTSEPTQAHWTLIKRIFRYLSGTKNLGIRFRWEKCPQLCGYCDADYANDMETRRSTSGYGIFYGQTLIAWRCQRQPIVSLSTTEAEYISGCELVKDLIPIREVFIEVGVMNDTPTPVYVDNLSAVHIAKNTGGQQRTKHIDVRQKWLTEQQDSGRISVEYIPGEKQLADMLTKPLHKGKFQANRSLIMAMISFLMLLFVASTDAFYFRSASPVMYEHSKYPYFKGLRDMNFTFTELNPCKPWFSNLTQVADWNDKLVSMCNNTFVQRTVNLLKHCKEHEPGTHTTGRLIREKRFLPAITGIFSGVGALGSVYAVYRSEANANNINIIFQEVKELREVHRQAALTIDSIRETIHELVETDRQIVQQLNFMQTDAINMKKSMYLTNRYETYFDEIGDMLRDVNKAVRMHRFSSALMDYVKKALWLEPAAEWSSVTKCTVRLDQDSNMILQMLGKIPEYEPSVKILQARSFKFWNKTSSQENCWMRYAGPRYVIANTSSNCFDDLDTNMIIDGSVTGLLCANKSQALKPVEKNFVAQGCFKNITIRELDAQVIRYDGDHRIYCPNSTIEVNGEQYICPGYVFALPIAHSFKLERYQFTATKSAEVVVNSLERQLNDDIVHQLDVGKVVIRFANTTSLNSSVTRLNNLVAKMTGRDFKLQEFSFVNAISKPFANVLGAFKSVWYYIEIGILVIAGTTAFVTLMAFAPVLNGILRLFMGTVRAIKRLLFSIRVSRPVQRLRRKRKHWDDSYVLRVSTDDEE